MSRHHRIREAFKAFYYVNQRDRPSEVDTSLPHCVAMAERCKEEDPSRRFVELIPGDEPVNLDDSTSRKEFETLLQGFCSPAGEWRYAEYNPFTAKISCARRYQLISLGACASCLHDPSLPPRSAQRYAFGGRRASSAAELNKVR
jgi:hypothetical protein